jgi:hypothetical protein
MSLLTHHKKSNKSRWFKDINIIRIGSIGLAVAALLVLGVFLHFANAPETTTSAAAASLSAASDRPADNANTSNNKNVRGAVISGNSLVYKTDKPFGEREPIILTLFANDLDDDQLIYSVSNMPAGASFDPDTLTFSWTPLYNQAGSHVLRFEVSDGLDSDYEDVTINVIQYGENWDLNVDGNANVLDIVRVGQHWNENGLTAWIKEDTNEDGVINVLDMIVVGQHWTG